MHLDLYNDMTGNAWFDIPSSLLLLMLYKIVQVERTPCRNCVVWAKSDNLARDVMKLSSDITVSSGQL